MKDVIFWLIMAAVFLFGFCLVDYFSRCLDEYRKKSRLPLKQEENRQSLHSERFFHGKS